MNDTEWNFHKLMAGYRQVFLTIIWTCFNRQQNLPSSPLPFPLGYVGSYFTYSLGLLTSSKTHFRYSPITISFQLAFFSRILASFFFSCFYFFPSGPWAKIRLSILKFHKDNGVYQFPPLPTFFLDKKCHFSFNIRFFFFSFSLLCSYSFSLAEQLETCTEPTL